MAAWIVVGVVVGWMAGVAGGSAATWSVMRADREHNKHRASTATRDPMFDKLLDRLLETALPERDRATTGDGGDGVAGSPGEYEPPDDDWAGARDWTDPFIGLERPTVARLAPGQGIPGVSQPVGDVVDEWREKGEGAFEEWAAETYAPDAAAAESAGSWVAPVDLGNGQVVE